MKKFILLLMLCPLIAQAQSLTFTWDGKIADLKAVDAPINDVFEEISAQTGIEIDMDPDNERTLTANYRCPIEPLLEGIAGSGVIEYAVDEQGNETITRVRSSRSEAGSSGAPPSSTVRSNNPRSQPYAGIGASIQLMSDGRRFRVIPLNSSTPAAKAGLKSTDQILEIDGKTVSSFGNQAELVKTVRGRSGTKVRFLVRSKTGSTRYVTVTRGEINFKKTERTSRKR